MGSDGRTYGVDVGVSDFNRVTFTEVARMIDELGLASHPVRQDVHFGTPSGRTSWACREGRWSFRAPCDDVDGLLREVHSFRTVALEVLHDPRFSACTLGEYLDFVGASRTFREAFLYPCAAGSFPMPSGDPSQYHARSLVRFRNVHGLVSDGPADRRVVEGGMHQYVAAYQRWFVAAGGRLLCGTTVRRVRRLRRGVELEHVDELGRRLVRRFDAVVFAGHAREALNLLEDAAPEERRALTAFRVQSARVVAHSDPALMGDERELWGAYNYLVRGGQTPRVGPTITFWPNRLASLPAAVPDVFVSMNPHVEPDPDSVLAARRFLHPIGCLENDRAAARLERLQGRRRTWFAGAYLRSPFVHESAFTSGMDAGRRLLEGEVRHARSGSRRRRCAAAAPPTARKALAS